MNAVAGRWLAWTTRLIGWLLLLLVGVLSLINLAEAPVDDVLWDKLNHAIAYAAIAGWWAALLPGRRWKAAAVALVFGLMMEGVQGLLPYRAFEWADMLANGVGVLLGLLLSLWWLPRGFAGWWSAGSQGA